MTGFRKLDWGERQECCKALANEPTGDNDAKVTAVIAAFLRKRRGPAAGSTAVHPQTGRSALRYYDAQFGHLRWIVYDSPERDHLTGERMDHLPAEGRGWVLQEQSWEGLV